MSKTTTTGKVFYAELDRFGYTLRAIGRTKDEAVETVMEKYRQWFEQDNDGQKASETGFNGEYFLDGKWFDIYDEEMDEKPETYEDCALDEMYVTECEFGKLFDI